MEVFELVNYHKNELSLARVGEVELFRFNAGRG